MLQPFKTFLETFNSIIRKDHINPQGNELRQLTVEWLRQPKMQTYLYLQRSLFADKNTSQTPSLINKLRVSLAYELCLIQYASGYRTNLDPSFANTPDKNLPFFPHRLSFLSYWLLGFAAVTSGVSGASRSSHTHIYDRSQVNWVAYIQSELPQANPSLGTTKFNQFTTEREYGQLPTFTAPWYPVKLQNSVNNLSIFPLNVVKDVHTIFPSRICAIEKTNADSLWVQPQIEYKPISMPPKLPAFEEKAPELNIANNYLWAVRPNGVANQIPIPPEVKTFMPPTDHAPLLAPKVRKRGEDVRVAAPPRIYDVCEATSSFAKADVEKDANKAGGEAVSLYRWSLAYTDSWYKKILVENAHLTGVVDLWLNLPTLQLEFASTSFKHGSAAINTILADDILSAPTQPIRLKHPLWMCDMAPLCSTQTDKLSDTPRICEQPQPRSEHIKNVNADSIRSITNSAFANREWAKHTGLNLGAANSASNHIWASDDQISRTKQNLAAKPKVLRSQPSDTEGATVGVLPRFFKRADAHSWRLWSIWSAEKGDIPSDEAERNISYETWKQPIHPDRRRLEKVFRAFFEKSAIPDKSKGRLFNLTRVRERLRTSMPHTMCELNPNLAAKESGTRLVTNHLAANLVQLKRRSYTPRVTVMTLLNHRHLLSLGGSNAFAKQDKESAFYDNETMMRLRDRLELKADRRERKESLQSRMRSKRKRWYPRPAWIRSQYLRSFWHVRQSFAKKASLLNTKILTSDLDKQLNQGRDRLYRSGISFMPPFGAKKNQSISNTKLNGLLGSPSLTSSYAGTTDPSYFGFSKQTEKVLRQYRLWKDGYRKRLLQNWTELYQSQKRHLIHQLTHQALPTTYLLGLPATAETPKFFPSWYTTFRGSFDDLPPFMVSASPQSFSSKWSQALSNAEYNRLVYERVQYRIRKLVEMGLGTDDVNAGATSEINVGRKVPGLVRAKNPSLQTNWLTSFWPSISRQELTWLPLDQNHSIWTLQRAWAMHQVQEPSVHIMMKPKNKLATAEKQLPKRKSILNAHSELWQYEQRRSQRKKSKSKMLWSKLAELKLASKFAPTLAAKAVSAGQPFLVERTQAWRAKLTRVQNKLNRLMGTKPVVRSQTSGTLSDRFTRYIGPGPKFWWVDIPGWHSSWDMTGFPTLRWESLESKNFSSEAYVTEDTVFAKKLAPISLTAHTMGLALFHVCALFSICSLPSVRDLLKFHAALLYKFMDLGSPFIDLVQKIVCDKLPLWWSARKHLFSQASVGLWRLFWDIRSESPLSAGVANTALAAKADTISLAAAAKNEVRATTMGQMFLGKTERRKLQESYRSHFAQAFSLALNRFPSRVKSDVWFKIKYTAWQLTQWSFVQADKIFQQNVKFFTDPVPVTLDFIAYAFFFHWTVDPVHVVPEALDRRLNISYRRQSRGIVGPWFMIGAMGATGSWLQRRVWSFAENWWYLINQLDSDLLRRKQASRRWWDVWVEVLLAAGEHFGTTFNQSPEAEEDQKRLLTALSQDTKWSWFDTTRLPPAPQYQSILIWPEDLSRMWGSQPQIVAPVQNLEAWMEAPPAKSVRSLPVVSATAPLLPIAGEIICDVFAGLWERRVAKNILVVGPPGRAKSIWVRALAGEMEVPLIHDSAWAYVNVDGNAPAGIQRLKQVFDSVAWHTPCLFLLEDIHAIGRRRSESLSSRETPRETTRGILMDSANASYEQQHEKHVFSRDAMTHYRRPVLGDFNKGVATYDFCFELFDPRFPVSLRRQNTTTSRHSFGANHSIYRPLLSRLQHFKGIKNSLNSGRSRAMPAWQMIAQKQQNLRPIYPRQRVLEQPLLGLTEVQEQGLQMNRTRYVIRAKVSWLTQQIFESVSQQLNTLNELLFILDSVRSQRGFAVLATTHVPEMLDPALRRPGRMDQTIHLDLKLGQWELLTSQQTFLRTTDRLNPVTALSPYCLQKMKQLVLQKKNKTENKTERDGVFCKNNQFGFPAKNLVFGQVAERFMQLHTPAIYAQQLNDWLFMGSYQIPRQVMPKLAFHVGQTFALSASGRQPSFLGLIAPRFAKSEAADLYQNLASWIDKRGLFAPRIWTTRLFELQNQKSLADPAGPPHTYVTLPAKRYEHYKRIERDFQRPAGFGWKNKLSLQQNVRVGLRLYGATSGATYQPFFRSETQSMASQNQLPTSFASAFWQLENLPLQTGTRSAIQTYVNRRLFERHSAYLTNQWWNSHWPEHTAEATDEYWDIRYVEQLGEDMYVDFPEPEQYYVPRERRWMLRNNSWQYPEQWANGWRDHFRQHAVLESYNACYSWLDQRREAFDALSWTFVQQGWMNDLTVWNTWKHFEHLSSKSGMSRHTCLVPKVRRLAPTP